MSQTLYPAEYEVRIDESINCLIISDGFNAILIRLASLSRVLDAIRELTKEP
jgi:hypothetical protein